MDVHNGIRLGVAGDVVQEGSALSLSITVSAMEAAGCSPAQIADVVRAYEAEDEAKRAVKRADNARRQRDTGARYLGDAARGRCGGRGRQ